MRLYVDVLWFEWRPDGATEEGDARRRDYQTHRGFALLRPRLRLLNLRQCEKVTSTAAMRVVSPIPRDEVMLKISDALLVLWTLVGE